MKGEKMYIRIDKSGQFLNTNRIESISIAMPPRKWIIRMISGDIFYVSDEIHQEICDSIEP